jgi:hypothetical protein
MPVVDKKGASRGLIIVLNDRREGKTSFKGTDQASRCPWEEKKQLQGNRGGLSIPVVDKKRISREWIIVLNDYKEEKQASRESRQASSKMVLVQFLSINNT